MSLSPKQSSDAKKSPKRLYESPRIDESGAFERLVLVCGHQPGSPDANCDPVFGGSANS